MEYINLELKILRYLENQDKYISCNDLCDYFKDIEIGYIVYILNKLLINDFIDIKNDCIKLKYINTNIIPDCLSDNIYNKINWDNMIKFMLDNEILFVDKKMNILFFSKYCENTKKYYTIHEMLLYSKIDKNIKLLWFDKYLVPISNTYRIQNPILKNLLSYYNLIHPNMITN